MIARAALTDHWMPLGTSALKICRRLERFRSATKPRRRTIRICGRLANAAMHFKGQKT
jgi:hypothetical protein